MTSNTNTSNMMASVDKVMALYMVEVANKIGTSISGISAIEQDMKVLWQAKRGELSKLLEAKPVKKRKRKRKSSLASSKKRAKSAYMFFCAEERTRIKEGEPEMKGREVMVELGKRWRQAKEGDISKWEKLAKKDKARVESESDEAHPDIREFLTTLPLAPPKPVEDKAKKIYTYSFWAKHHRSEIGRSTGLKSKELTKELSKQWKALGQEEKAEWKEAAIKASEED
jgi:hypothetical protein